MIQSDKETFLQLTERIDRIALSAFGSNSENSNKYLSIVRPQLISICQNSNTHLQKLTAASDADILLLLQNKINSSPSLPIQKNSKPSNKKKTLISCGVLGLFIVLLLVAAGVLFMFGDIFPSTKKKTIAQTETQANVHQPDTQSPSIHKQSFTYQSLIDAVQQVKQKEADRMNEIDKMMGVCPFISGEVTDRFYKDENGNDIDILLVYGSVHWQDKPKGGPFGKAGNILVVNPEQGGVFSDSNKYFESLSHDYFGRSDDQAVNAFGVEVSSFIYKPNEQITDIGQGIRDLQVEIDSAKRRIPEIYNGYIHSLFADCTYPNETSECKQQLEKLISSVTEKGFFNSFNFASPDIPTMIMGKKKIGTRAQGRSISNYIQYFDKENNCLVSLDEKQQFFNAYKIIAPKELSQYTSDELIKSSLAEFSELHPDYCNAPLLHPTAEAVAKEMGYKLIKQHANLDKMPTLSIVSIKKDTDRITNTNTIPWQECHAIDKYKNFLYHNNAKLLYETPNGLVNKQPQQRPWRCLSNQEKFDLTNRLQRELPSHFMRNIDNWIMEVKSVSSSREIVLSLPP
ncbi:MAG: hypothetical protein PHX74_06310, partial [Candidatus Sumerlaeales bacterium]|nr:hypothetical protein [Candidatus Sumerlaeales bacterium]